MIRCGSRDCSRRGAAEADLVGVPPLLQAVKAFKPEQAAAAAAASVIMAGSAQALTYDEFQSLTYLQVSERSALLL